MKYRIRDPAELPVAAPGTIDIVPFRHLPGQRRMKGSVTDMSAEQPDERAGDAGPEDMSMRDAMMPSYKDNPFMADPAPVNYPVAAPGSSGTVPLHRITPGRSAQVR